MNQSSSFEGFNGAQMSAQNPRQTYNSHQYNSNSPPVFGMAAQQPPEYAGIQEQINREITADGEFEDQLYAVMLKLRDIRNRAIRAASPAANRGHMVNRDISAMVDSGLEQLGFPGFGNTVYSQFDQQEMQRRANRARTGQMPGNPTLVQRYQNTPDIAPQYSPPRGFDDETDLF